MMLSTARSYWSNALAGLVSLGDLALHRTPTYHRPTTTYYDAPGWARSKSGCRSRCCSFTMPNGSETEGSASEMPSSGGSRREATVEAKEEKRLRAAHLHV